MVMMITVTMVILIMVIESIKHLKLTVIYLNLIVIKRVSFLKNLLLKIELAKIIYITKYMILVAKTQRLKNKVKEKPYTKKVI